MLRKIWGRNGQVRFASEQEYYRIIGYLARSKGETELTWEHNEEQGAWGSEGRIHFYDDIQKFPNNFSYTKGRGNVTYRVNCNDFVEHLSNRFKFVQGKYQNIAAIRQSIPQEWVKYFDEGVQGLGHPTTPITRTTVFAPIVPKQTTNVSSVSPEWWSGLNVGDKVKHIKFGEGRIDTISNFLVVNFMGVQKKFQYPDCFVKGFFEKI